MPASSRHPETPGRSPARAGYLTLSKETAIETADLLVTLVLALAAASIGALAAGLLRQSLVLGYIAAGMSMGPHTPGIVLDIAAVEELADIGIILLMFAIGVQLSLNDLFRVGKVALIGGNVQVIITIGAGFGVGTLLGWDWVESLFFGAVISNSSSTVLSKVLLERGEIESLHSRIGLAWSTVQDFGTVVLVVLLSSLAGEDNGGLHIEVLEAVGLAVLFLVLVVPIGLYVLPEFFDRVAALGNQEVFVLSAAGIALGIALLASVFGVSVALGAFVGGILVGRSDLSHEVFNSLRPLRDLFAGMFFVSVGMLIDPKLIIENLGLVALTVALIIGFKGALSTGITAAFGYRAKTAVMTGAVLGQSAEFSFLMARTGSELGALSNTVFGVLLAGAAVSIVLAPATLAASRPIGRWLEPLLPPPPLSQLGDDDITSVPRGGHAILCGYGRVGRVIAESMRQQAIDFMVIEQDGNSVRELRDEGIAALQGSASNETLLERAGVQVARVLIVAVPDPLAAREILSIGRRLRPDIDVVVRTHSMEERLELERRGANEAVVGEMELALEMSRHTLRRFGMNMVDAERLLQKLRGAAAQV